MKNKKNKTLSIITLVILLTLTIFTTNIGSIKAATIQPNAFLSVNPNPVGVDQSVLITIWLAPIMPSQDDLFHGFTVTITKPDGTTITKGPLPSYAHGGQFFQFIPTTIGDYTLKFNYAGETFTSTGDVYQPAESPVTTLVVQEDPIPWWPENPIPTDYWTRPINSQNRNWASISGNWLMEGYNSTFSAGQESVGAYNAYSTAPRTPHIAWTKALGLGGLVGGESGSLGYYTGQSYDSHVTPPIIMGGRLYYRTHRSNFGNQIPYDGFVCVDLRTGEELWQNDDGDIDMGQDYFLNTPNGQGVIPFLWDTSGSTWDVYDAINGEWIYNFENAMSAGQGRIRYGDDGTIYTYHNSGKNDWLAMWNSTKALYENGLFYSFTPDVPGLGNYYPSPGTYDWRLGIEWNVTVPHHEGTGRPSNPTAIQYPSLYKISGNKVWGLVRSVPNIFVAYDMNTGQELWSVTSQVNNIAEVGRAIGDGVFATFQLDKMTWIGRSLNTGNVIWESDPQVYPWGAYYTYASAILNGKLFGGAWDGYMHAFDVDTGKELWKFYAGDSGRETTQGTWAMWNGPILADGVVFCGGGEETPTQPLPRGNKLFAIDEETGEEIWSISGQMGTRAIADGYLITYNGYDNLLYVFGKGPSATTVSAPKTEVMQGQKIVIEGTVTDQSAGAMDTPAISDEDMGPWMEYLYMQQPAPMDAKGVDVSIDVIDANGNFRNVGTATSDMSGVYSLVWEADIPGKYTVIATFAGSESYGSSFAQTNFYVEEAPAPTPPPEATPAPQTDTYIAGSTIAIIAAIGVVAFLLLRKK